MGLNQQNLVQFENFERWACNEHGGAKIVELRLLVLDFVINKA
jgi:hypothetical protein